MASHIQRYARARRYAASTTTIAIASFFVFRIAQVTISHSEGLLWSTWAYSEWLINYEGGFVRRGLAGELIKALAKVSDTLWSANCVVFVVFASFTVCATTHLLSLIQTSGSVMAAAFYLLVPGGLYTMSTWGSIFYRKEMLFHLFLYTVVFLFRRKYMARALAPKIIFVFLVSAALMLTHESFIFIAAPAILLVLHNSTQGSPHARPILTAYAVFMFVLFVVLCFWHGGKVQVDAIWASIGPLNRALISADGLPDGGIFAVGWSLSEGLKLPYTLLLSGMAVYWFAPALVSLLGIAIYSAHITGTKHGTAKGIVLYSTICVGISPLFVLAWDWGRWISAANIVFLATFDTLDRLPDRLERSVRYFEAFVPDIAAGRLLLAAAAILSCCATLRVPDCCISVHGASDRFYTEFRKTALW